MNRNQKRVTAETRGRRKVKVVGLLGRAYLLKTYGLVKEMGAYVGDLKLPDGRYAKAVRPRGKAFWRIAFIIGEWGEASISLEEKEDA